MSSSTFEGLRQFLTNQIHKNIYIYIHIAILGRFTLFVRSTSMQRKPLVIIYGELMCIYVPKSSTIRSL